MASAVAPFKELPMAGLTKELPAAPTASEKSAVIIKELPAAPTASEKPAVIINELPAAPSAAEKSAVITKELPAAPTASKKSAPSALALLNTKGGALSRRDDYDDDASDKPTSGTADDRLRLALFAPKPISTDAMDLYGEPRTLAQLLASMMEDGGAASGTGGGFTARGWWVSKEDDDAVVLKVAMPGLGKEHVKVSAEKDVLLIKGEGDKDPEDGDGAQGPARYSRRFKLPAEAFTMDQIKAEMDKGVLKVTVPKIKPEVFQIKVE